MKTKILELKRHLLTGTSHMLPFIVAGGVLLALSVMLNGKGAQPEGAFLTGIWDMGIAGFTLFVPVLGGYIAYSIADRPALAPGRLVPTWQTRSMPASLAPSLSALSLVMLFCS